MSKPERGKNSNGETNHTVGFLAPLRNSLAGFRLRTRGAEGRGFDAAALGARERRGRVDQREEVTMSSPRLRFRQGGGAHDCRWRG